MGARRRRKISKSVEKKVMRKQLRDFLGDLLDSGQVPGLEWIDKQAKVFRMPWKHARRKSFASDKDALLIKLWAINTGRYRDEKPDHVKWKINFRCALNSLRRSIVHVGKQKAEDRRVFRFVDSRRGRGKNAVLGSTDEDAYANSILADVVESMQPQNGKTSLERLLFSFFAFLKPKARIILN